MVFRWPALHAIPDVLRAFVKRIGWTRGRHAVFVGALGKHPGWTDHITDLPDPPALLGDLYKTLYAGIAYQITNELWRRREREGEAIDFGHFVYFRSGSRSVVARLWPSRDGVKPVPRTDFPMVVCVQLPRMSLRDELELAIPALREAERQCRAVDTAAGVATALAAMKASVSTAAEQVVAKADVPSPAQGTVRGAEERADVRRLLEHPLLGPEGAGMLELLSHFERHLDQGSRHLNKIVGHGNGADEARVPACSAEPVDALAMWAAFALALVGPKSTFMVVLPDGGTWVDLLLSRPDVSQFGALRLSDKARPRMTDERTAIDDELRRRLETFLVRAAGLEELPPPDASIPVPSPLPARNAPPANP